MGKKGGGRVRVKQVGPKAPSVVNPFDSMNIPPEEMINLPPKPDSNMTHVWPLDQTFSMDYKQFSQIYPNYIDSNKTIKRGRRISKEEAVPEPSVLDMTHALQAMRIPHAVQPYKGYSRDPESQWDNPGRVLVDLTTGKKEDVVSMGTDGAFDVDEMPEIPGDDDDDVTGKKKHLMREIARRLKTLPARTQRLEQKKKEEEEAEKKAKEEEAAAHKASSQKASTGTSGKKKKGKKKR